MVFLVAQLGKNVPAVQETCVPPACRGDLLEEEMASPSSTLAWESPGTGESGGYVHRVCVYCSPCIAGRFFMLRYQGSPISPSEVSNTHLFSRT